MRRLNLLPAVLLLFFLLDPHPAGADEPRSVYGASPPSTFMLYALDPDLIGGWNTPLRDYEKSFIPEKYWELPILGGWYGQGFIPDRETLLASGLKKAFILSSTFHDAGKITQTLESLGMRVVVVPGMRMDSLAECFRILGREFGRPERGEELARYTEETLGKVRAALADLPAAQRPRVYFAQEEDGLGTACKGSERSEVLEAAGAENVHACLKGTNESLPRISFEQLMAYDPDVILIYSPDLAAAVSTDAKWSRLRAVREGRAYLVPRGPFSWLDRPAGYMRVIGVQWLANLLHPDRLPLDPPAETKLFLKLFFHIDATDAQVEALLHP
jgi:iron complex transport system substrate-binding protein